MTSCFASLDLKALPKMGFVMEGKNLRSNGANSFHSSGSKFFPLKGVDPHFGRGG